MIQKLPLSEIFKESYRIFKLHFAKILLLCAIIVLPLSLVSAYISELVSNDTVVSSFYDKMEEITTLSEDADLSGYYADIIQYYETIIPYVAITLVLAVAGLVFTAALILLARDESRHGALTCRRFDGDIIVVHENEEEVTEVGSAFDYFSLAIKILPKILITIIIGFAISSLGFMLILPGILFLIITFMSIETVVQDNSFGMKPIIKTGAIMLRNPRLVVLLVLPELLKYIFDSSISTLLYKIGIEGIGAVVALGITDAVITFVLSLFTIAYTLAFIDGNDRIIKKQ